MTRSPVHSLRSEPVECSVTSGAARIHAPIDVQGLVAESVIEAGLKSGSHGVRAVRTHLGNEVHVAHVPDVLYLPDLGLQVLDDRVVPSEGLRNPHNLGHLQNILSRQAAGGSQPRYATAFAVPRVEEDVCILSNVFSNNFSHFTEELLKVIILERSGLAPRYVSTSMPAYVTGYWDALGLDRARLLLLPEEPVEFRSAFYTSTMDFSDLGRCPDILFELRDRMHRAASGVASPHGSRLWLERGANAIDATRELVNPDEVARCLDEYGFTRLDIGSLPMPEQIAAVRDAEVIAGPHGAAFTHAMYMKPRSVVLEVFSPHFLKYSWSEICRVLRHRYLMLAAENTPDCAYPFRRRVCVPCKQLRLTLQSLA